MAPFCVAEKQGERCLKQISGKSGGWGEKRMTGAAIADTIDSEKAFAQSNNRPRGAVQNYRKEAAETLHRKEAEKNGGYLWS